MSAGTVLKVGQYYSLPSPEAGVIFSGFYFAVGEFKRIFEAQKVVNG